MFMQRSRRTTCGCRKKERDVKAGLRTDVPTGWTMAGVLSSPCGGILRPSHMVRRSVGSVSSKLVLGRLNAPCVLAFMRVGPLVHESGLCLPYSFRPKSSYDKGFLRSIILAHSALHSPGIPRFPLRLWGERVPKLAVALPAKNT